MLENVAVGRGGGGYWQTSQMRGLQLLNYTAVGHIIHSLSALCVALIDNVFVAAINILPAIGDDEEEREKRGAGSDHNFMMDG
jgi:hypothetical protein